MKLYTFLTQKMVSIKCVKLEIKYYCRRNLIHVNIHEGRMLYKDIIFVTETVHWKARSAHASVQAHQTPVYTVPGRKLPVVLLPPSHL